MLPPFRKQKPVIDSAQHQTYSPRAQKAIEDKVRLYRSKIPTVARDIIRQLTAAGDIEVNSRDEAELDIQSVLNEYVRMEREITERTKDTLEARNLPHGQFGRTKRLIAEQAGIGLGEDGILWMCNQILETFMESKFIEEIFSTDQILRRKMVEILRRHMLVEEELDEEVRKRVQNLQEGTQQWDIEYARAMEQIRLKRGLKND